MSTMAEPLVLYSAITKLAYWIGQRFYREQHYVWCAPISSDRTMFANPPSSDPLRIWARYAEDIRGGDRHSEMISANRRGLVRGAQIKCQAEAIDGRTRDLIEQIVGSADLTDFSPLLIVIPFSQVRHINGLVPIDERASPTSDEYRFEALPRSAFDVLEIKP
jgi:hypothetical protein